VPVGERHLVRRRGVTNAGVIHEDVQATVSADDLAHAGVALFLVRDVHDEGADRWPDLRQLGNGLLVLLGITPRDHHGRAALQQPTSNALADATVTAGYEADLAVKVEALHSPHPVACSICSHYASPRLAAGASHSGAACSFGQSRQSKALFKERDVFGASKVERLSEARQA